MFVGQRWPLTCPHCGSGDVSPGLPQAHTYHRS
jgi:hypothetical protein